MMNYKPSLGVGYFEPGCISCACCGHKSEDPWDTDPEDIKWISYEDLGGQWECIECIAGLHE